MTNRLCNILVRRGLEEESSKGLEIDCKIYFWCDGAVDKGTKRIGMSYIAYKYNYQELKKYSNCMAESFSVLVETIVIGEEIRIALTSRWKKVCFFST